MQRTALRERRPRRLAFPESLVQRKRGSGKLVALSPRESERGSTLVETLVCVAIIAMLVTGAAATMLGRDPYAIRAAAGTFGSIVADARAVARTTGIGATLAVSAGPRGGFIATLLPYRPIEGARESAPVRTLTSAVTLEASSLESTEFAIFISSSGTASAAAWGPHAGTLAAEPACTGEIAIAFRDGSRTEPHAIGCTDAVFR